MHYNIKCIVAMATECCRSTTWYFSEWLNSICRLLTSFYSLSSVYTCIIAYNENWSASYGYVYNYAWLLLWECAHYNHNELNWSRTSSSQLNVVHVFANFSAEITAYLWVAILIILQPGPLLCLVPSRPVDLGLYAHTQLAEHDWGSRALLIGLCIMHLRKWIQHGTNERDGIIETMLG